MRVLPRMVVLVPCDAVEAQKATVATAFNGSPTYIRLAREKSVVFTTQDTPFEIGQAEVFRVGQDATIVACGLMVYNSLLAAEELATEGIDCEVINSHTIKPLDGQTILTSVKKTGAVVSAEEHQVNGGLGSAVAEFLAKNHSVPQEFIGVQDRFGESGTPDELIVAFHMAPVDIKEAVRRVITRKR